MTNEEAAKELMMAYEDLKHMCYMDCGREAAFNKAFETLKAEPCEDAVSREAALKALAELPHEYKTKEQRARTGGIAACQVIVGELPPVSPKPQTGKWTDAKLYFDSSWATCSECKECARQKTKNDGLGFSIWFLKYCPNCGAKMEGENEAKK